MFRINPQAIYDTAKKIFDVELDIVDTYVKILGKLGSLRYKVTCTRRIGA